MSFQRTSSPPAAEVSVGPTLFEPSRNWTLNELNSKFTSLTSSILSEFHLRRFCSNNSFAALAVPCTCSSNQNQRWCNRRIFAWFLLQDNNSSCRCLELTYSYFRWLEQLKSRMKSRKLDIAYLFYSKNV